LYNKLFATLAMLIGCYDGRLVVGGKMRRLHLAIGVFAVVAFLITGQLMRHHTPPMAAMSDSARLMFRSRHIYILAAGLVNLVLGVYFRRQGKGWRRSVQAAASAFLIASPVLLVVAFTVEPGLGLREEMPWSHAGLYALFLGSIGHLACGAVISEELPVGSALPAKEPTP
jgi:hypothetical protein